MWVDDFARICCNWLCNLLIRDLIVWVWLRDWNFFWFWLVIEAYLGGDDLEVEDEYKQKFSCSFCADEFDIVGLFCHMDDEHQMELKNGVGFSDTNTTVYHIFKS
jgi:drought induced 19 zinc-binding protein Di19